MTNGLDKTDTRYSVLLSVLSDAAASLGKGAERHDPNGERFEDQQIVQIGEWLGSNHFEIGQAVKKAIESARLPHDRARAELLGAINYLAAAVIVLDRGNPAGKPVTLSTVTECSVCSGTPIADDGFCSVVCRNSARAYDNPARPTQ